jgi:hypothetical protein
MWNYKQSVYRKDNYCKSSSTAVSAETSLFNPVALSQLLRWEFRLGLFALT